MRFLTWIAAAVYCITLLLFLPVPPRAAADGPPTEGRLLATAPDGQALGPCPLEHTAVLAEISGFVARVNVTQTFNNPHAFRIEAVYAFPLSPEAAVDDMTMTIGDRVIRGVIKPSDEARKIYEAAKAAGHVAGLLDQERPNIFTQSLANIEPGAKIEIRISYVETLDWEEGVHRFDFPMVVGPRYIPGGGSAPAPMTTGQPTPQVPDAEKITPPVVPPGLRAGHDISLEVRLNAGLPIRTMKSELHEIEVGYEDSARSIAVVKLKNEKTIPNKDFVLSFQTAADDIADAVLTHHDERGGFFTLVLQPPQRIPPEWIVPKEMIFVIDKSGSMSGFPIETAKKVMRQCIEHLNPGDTFNLMTFEGGVGFCFEKPVANTPENKAKAQQYLAALQGSGGTEMMKAIDACLGGQRDPDRVRVVCFMTDGYVGNDLAILDAVRKNAGVARVFSFGIGTSVNRYLLDGMARAGRGEVEYVLSEAQCEAAAQRFYERVSTPVLTDLAIDWNGLEVSEVYPALLPDLFSAKPVVIKGRYVKPGAGEVTLRGQRGREKYERKIAVNLPAEQPENESLASLWARATVEDLMNRNLAGIQSGTPQAEIKDEIVKLGLAYRLLTQFTSFVAVEEATVTEGGQAVKVLVPVEMPEGVSYEGVFGVPVDAGEPMHCLRSTVAAPLAKPAAGGRGGLYRGGRLDTARPATSPPLREARGEAGGPTTHRADQDVTTQPAANLKLPPELRGLAAKLGDKQDYREGLIEVRGGRIQVLIRLTDRSEPTLARLRGAGATILFTAQQSKAIIASVEVKKLEELASVAEILSIEPTGTPAPIASPAGGK